MYRRLILALLAAVAVLGPGAAAAADFGFRGTDVRLGAIFPSDWDTGYAAGASVNIGELAPGLYLYPAAAFATAETSSDVGLLGTSVDLEFTSFTAGAEVKYFPDGVPSGWYVGGGPYLSRVTHEVALVAGGTTAAAEVEADEFGVVALGGYRFGKRLGIEARYDTTSVVESAALFVTFSFGSR